MRLRTASTKQMKRPLHPKMATLAPCFQPSRHARPLEEYYPDGLIPADRIVSLLKLSQSYSTNPILTTSIEHVRAAFQSLARELNSQLLSLKNIVWALQVEKLVKRQDQASEDEETSKSCYVRYPEDSKQTSKVVRFQKRLIETMERNNETLLQMLRKAQADIGTFRGFYTKTMFSEDGGFMSSLSKEEAQELSNANERLLAKQNAELRDEIKMLRRRRNRQEVLKTNVFKPRLNVQPEEGPREPKRNLKNERTDTAGLKKKLRFDIDRRALSDAFNAKQFFESLTEELAQARASILQCEMVQFTEGDLELLNEVTADNIKKGEQIKAIYEEKLVLENRLKMLAQDLVYSDNRLKKAYKLMGDYNQLSDQIEKLQKAIRTMKCEKFRLEQEIGSITFLSRELRKEQGQRESLASKLADSEAKQKQYKTEISTYERYFKNKDSFKATSGLDEGLDQDLDIVSGLSSLDLAQVDAEDVRRMAVQRVNYTKFHYKKIVQKMACVVEQLRAQARCLSEEKEHSLSLLAIESAASSAVLAILARLSSLLPTLSPCAQQELQSLLLEVDRISQTKRKVLVSEQQQWKQKTIPSNQ